jgi:hypothetical protein
MQQLLRKSGAARVDPDQLDPVKRRWKTGTAGPETTLR